MVQVIQLVGAMLILVAFALAQFRKIDQAAYGYLVPNFLGAVVLGVIAVIERQWGFVLLEVVWGLVSLWSIIMKATGHATAPH